MKAKDERNEVLQRIDVLCEQRGWTHYALAKQADIPYSSISNMFHRDTYPSLPMLFKLCEGFHIPVSDFFLDESREDLTLNAVESSMVRGFRTLAFHDQELVSAYMNGLMKKL